MRVVLIAGDDAGGRSVVAAATAIGSANAGRKTALVHIDGSLRHRDLLDADEVDALVAVTLDPLVDRDTLWGEIGPRLGAAVDDLNPIPLEAAEVAVLPGVDDIGLLLSLHRLITTASNDVVVVALCELSRAITLLAIPEGIDRLLDRAFPISVRVEQVLAGAGPSVSALASHEAIDSLRFQLTELANLLHSSSTTIRLVCASDQAAYVRAVSAYKMFSLLGFSVDGVVISGLAQQGEGWPEPLVIRHRELVAEVENSLAPTPVYALPLSVEDRSLELGASRTAAAALYAGMDPVALPAPKASPEVEVDPDDSEIWKWRIPIAFAHKADVSVADAGADLVIEAVTADFGRVRRVRRVPALLLRCTLQAAQLRSAGTSSAHIELTYRMHPVSWLRS